MRRESAVYDPLCGILIPASRYIELYLHEPHGVVATPGAAAGGHVAGPLPPPLPGGHHCSNVEPFIRQHLEHTLKVRHAKHFGYCGYTHVKIVWLA